ncbi:MAG: aspartate aminotransferase [Chloroflexi bacterium]|nr:aspartate aminotransferase [Chloroflexota bacterium]|tara:strand:+ start:1523 stop:2686 length:1164 start_codon:yes stop_codon:yes gene_type:complete
MKLAKRMSRLGTETAFEVLAKAQKLEAQGKNVIHLEIGEPDFDTPENIVSAGQNALSNGFTSYNPSPGYGDLRDVIAKDISTSRGIKVSGENVIVTPGGKPIMFFVMLALIENGDEVLYPNPGFPIYESMIEFCGGTAVPMQLHGDRDFNIDISEVRNQITPKTKLMIINSPNNPCGSILGDSELEELANIAKENNILVLSDEIYSRFLFEGDHNSITTFPDMLSRTIVLDGLSKTYAMTGWRIGYGVFPDNLIEPISRLVTNSVSCTASFTQQAAIEAISGSQKQPNLMVDEFKRRRNIIVDGLNSIPGFNCAMPKGAFYAFPDISGTGFSSGVLANRLLEDAGVALLAGECFGKYGEGFLRISFANSEKNLNEALSRIEKFIKEN